MAIDVQALGRHDTEIAVKLVDCDVHAGIASLPELIEYVPEPWRSRYYDSDVFRNDATEVEGHAAIYIPPLHTLRKDAIPPGGGAPGSDPAFLEQQLFHEAGIDYAILVPLSPRAKVAQPELETAIFSALNTFMAATWLSAHNTHGRYRGVIRVCPYDARGAVAEIERWAGHPYVTQVYMIPEAAAPFGQPQFWPIYEAAESAGFSIGMHVSRMPGMRLLTPAGFPSYHLEIFPQWPLYFMGHLASLIFEGVFERFPGLHVVGIEGGFTWLTPFAWRLDRYWDSLGRGATGSKRRPSEVLREHVRATTQPLEEPNPSKALLDVIEWGHLEDVLMFATDYPHYDFDDPAWIVPRLPKDVRDRILAGNAIELYGLPATRPLDAIDIAAGRA